MTALLFPFTMAGEHPRISVEGFLRIKAPFYQTGGFAACPMQPSATIKSPSARLDSSYWEVTALQGAFIHCGRVISVIQHFPVSTSEGGGALELCCLFSQAESSCDPQVPRCESEGSVKEHLPVFLMVQNREPENLAALSLL